MAESEVTIPQLATSITSYCDFLGVFLQVTKANQPCLMTGVWKVWGICDSISCKLYALLPEVHNSILHVPVHYSQTLVWFPFSNSCQGSVKKCTVWLHMCVCAWLCTRSLWGIQLICKRCYCTKLVRKVKYMQFKIFRTAHLKWYISEANTLLFMQLGTPTSKTKPQEIPQTYIFLYDQVAITSSNDCFSRGFLLLCWSKLEQDFRQALARAMNLADSWGAHKSIKYLDTTEDR